MKWFKRLGLIFAVILITFLVLYNVPWRYKIDTTIKGVQSRIGDENYVEDVSIIVKGVYKQFLFKEDIFDGNISVDKYDFTAYGSNTPFYFNNSFSVLIYTRALNGSPINKALGSIISQPDFKQLLITVYEPIESDSKGWSADNGLFISAPAENRDQAIIIAKTLSEKQKWLVNWH